MESNLDRENAEGRLAGTVTSRPASLPRFFRTSAFPRQGLASEFLVFWLPAKTVFCSLRFSRAALPASCARSC